MIIIPEPVIHQPGFLIHILTLVKIMAETFLAIQLSYSAITIQFPFPYQVSIFIITMRRCAKIVCNDTILFTALQFGTGYKPIFLKNPGDHSVYGFFFFFYLAIIFNPGLWGKYSLITPFMKRRIA